MLLDWSGRLEKAHGVFEKFALWVGFSLYPTFRELLAAFLT
ncbi:3866_t:CDS:2 [Dentiscutata erythropus]|uniref:3866_t:CDS:1 n=1 Tax=Dentiscutata erythropus TaxID=1348616 RepID=A0A9N8W7W7_9GLOM|nr:3866_t:CDS:2 [Dentiscutata erythropus]